ncbi:hypothetical protein ASD46_25220 [Rhizobium sp. Root491]|uniref:hypothetical protein n=1 Tax=Rhizobium sp. Root491 TaxID=1736548 RepID=UPI000715CF90|nr:hypothetical protein [Rhizobium sp. Root491]KQY49250.1 hypothetical protein ASD46_25220 [Rhizobium sp. Root491]
MTAEPGTINGIPDINPEEGYLLPVNADALLWAIYDRPTREAYRKCTGEDAGPFLDRYVAWAQENIIGDAF